MKSFLLAFIAVVCLASPVAAQTTLKVHWDYDPAALSYTIGFDGGAPISVPNVITPSCNCIEVQRVFTTGAHSLSATAVFPALACTPASACDPTQTIESVPVVVTFTLNGGGQIKNIKLTK